MFKSAGSVTVLICYVSLDKRLEFSEPLKPREEVRGGNRMSRGTLVVSMSWWPAGIQHVLLITVTPSCLQTCGTSLVGHQ